MRRVTGGWSGRRVRRTVAGVLGVAVVLLVVRSSWPPSTSAAGPVERVVVISVPTLTWEDIDPATTPHLAALVQQSVIANLSPATAELPVTAGGAYVTLGAGARARGAPGSDGLASRGAAGTVVHRGVDVITRRNGGLPFGADVGALGSALAASDRSVAVVANADGASVGSGRQAVAGVMRSDGTVPGGSVSGRLLMADPAAPFGRRLDPEAVTRAYEAVSGSALVLVEASDLARADADDAKRGDGRRRSTREVALRETDDLIGRLVERVDPAAAILLVGPYPSEARPSLTVAALRAPDLSPGLMRSSVTRRSGSVTLVDVAPTVLGLLSVDAPASMEGRPFERDRGGGDATQREERLRGEADDARQVGRLGLLLPRLLVGAVALLAGAVLTSIARRRDPRWPQVAALALLAVGPVTYLARVVPTRTTAGTLAVIVAGVLVAAGACSTLRRRDPLLPLCAVLAFVAVIVVVDVLAGSPLQFNSALGFSPLVAARFSGLGNLAFAQLAAAAIMLAGLAAVRLAGRQGRRAAAAILCAAVLVVALPWWGADVGGTLSLVPAAGVTLALLSGARPRPRRLVLLALATVAAVAVVAAVDLALPEGLQTHLARLATVTERGGFHSFVIVIDRKLHASLATFGKAPWTLLLPVSALFAAGLVWAYPERLEALTRQVPEVRAVGAGLATVALLGSVLNDSGLQVAGMVLAVSVPALAFLLCAAPAPSPHPPRPEPEGTGAPSDDADVLTGAAPEDGAAPSPRRRRAAGVLVLLAGASLAVRLPALLAGRHLSYHEGVFALTAVAMRHGAVPFRDLPSAQGPLFPLLVWVGDAVGLHTLDAPRIVAVVAGVLATVAAFVVGRRLSTATGGVLAALLVGASGSVLWVSGPLASDGVAIALALVALALITGGDEHRWHPARLPLAGAALAAAVAVKVLVAPVIVPMLGVLAMRRDRRALTTFCASVGATSLLFWLPFGIGRSWDQSVRYHLESPRLLPVAEVLRQVLELLRDRDPMLLAGLAAAVAAVVIVVVRAGRAAPAGRPVLAELAANVGPRLVVAALLATWAALELVLLLAEPAFYTHHTAVLVAPVALVVVVVTPRSALLAVALVALSFFPWQFDRSVRPLLTPGRYGGPETTAIRDLEALPAGTQVISDEPGLVWRAGRSSPPAAVDISDKAIAEGRITSASVLGWARRADVCAVLVWDRSLAVQLGAVDEGLARDGFVVVGHYGVIETSRPGDPPPPLRTLWRKPGC